MNEYYHLSIRTRKIVKSIVGFAESEIKGEGTALFIYAHTNHRAIELSKTENGIWVEFWESNSEPPEHDQTFESYSSAVSGIRHWLDRSSGVYIL